jgi:hypothetical protein
VKHITIDGRQIDLETDDFGIAPRKRRRTEPWVKAPLAAMAAELKIIGTPRAVVLLILRYEAWKANGKPFTLPNKRVAQYGVGRGVKPRVLAKLEAAGVIRVKREGRKAPTIQWTTGI